MIEHKETTPCYCDYTYHRGGHCVRGTNCPGCKYERKVMELSINVYSEEDYTQEQWSTIMGVIADALATHKDTHTLKLEIIYTE